MSESTPRDPGQHGDRAGRGSGQATDRLLSGEKHARRSHRGAAEGRTALTFTEELAGLHGACVVCESGGDTVEPERESRSPGAGADGGGHRLGAEVCGAPQQHGKATGQDLGRRVEAGAGEDRDQRQLLRTRWAFTVYSAVDGEN